MFKKLFCCFALISSHQLSAMDPEHSFHAPRFKNEVLNFLDTYIEKDKSTLKKDVELGATIAVANTILVPGALATFVHNGLNKSGLTSSACTYILSEGFAGSMLLLYPLAILLTLPMSAFGAVGGLCTNIAKGISLKLDEKEFDRHVAYHMYQWINIVKQGRLAIRAELEAWIKVHEGHGNSLCTAIEEVLQGDKFKQYFGDLNFKHEDMIKLLAQIGKDDDNLNGLFEKLSQLVKISELSEQEWLELERALLSFKDKTDFPELSAEDIKTYLFVSVYYFTLVNNVRNCGINWLRSFIS
jgi:hypothetical protein